MQVIVSQCQLNYPIRSSWFSLIFEFDCDLLHMSCPVAPWLEGSLTVWDGGSASSLGFWAGTSKLGKAGTLLLGLIASGV